MCEEETTTTVPNLNFGSEEVGISLAFSDIAPDVFDVEPDAIPINGGHLVYKDYGFNDKKVTIAGVDTRRCYRFILDDTVGEPIRARIYTRPEVGSEAKPLLSELQHGVFDILLLSVRVECGGLLFEHNEDGDKYTMSGLDVRRCYRLVIVADAEDETRIIVHSYPDYPKQEKEDV